jgi:hypothetical protein
LASEDDPRQLLARGVWVVHMDRLQEYTSMRPEVVASVMYPHAPFALETVLAAEPNGPGELAKGADDWGRIRFFYDNPSDDPSDAIYIGNGFHHHKPDLDEPHIYDGRHRYLATVLRGDRTIKADFRVGDYDNFLTRPVIAYLVGRSDVKPWGERSKFCETPEYEAEDDRGVYFLHEPNG